MMQAANAETRTLQDTLLSRPETSRSSASTSASIVRAFEHGFSDRCGQVTFRRPVEEPGLQGIFQLRESPANPGVLHRQLACGAAQ